MLYIFQGFEQRIKSDVSVARRLLVNSFPTILCVHIHSLLSVQSTCLLLVKGTLLFMQVLSQLVFLAIINIVIFVE